VKNKLVIVVVWCFFIYEAGRKLLEQPSYLAHGSAGEKVH